MKSVLPSAFPGGAALVALSLLATGCARNGGDAEQKLIVTGSSTVAPLLAEIAQRYESENPGVRIDVQTGGSAKGIADAAAGLVDLGMASRDLKPSEEGLVAHPIARDGVCIIVHRENPVTELNAEQVRAIYRGELRNWQAVGGADAPITVVNKAEGRGTLEVFQKHFGLRGAEIRADVVVGDNEHGIKTVTGNPNAIGYVSIGTAEYDAQHGLPIKLLPADGVPASVLTLSQGAFPIARSLNLISKPGLTGRAADFVAYARSAAVHDLIAAQYFVPNRPDAEGSMAAAR